MVNRVGAALILADKSDVRRSRVRTSDGGLPEDITPRENYAVTNPGGSARRPGEICLKITSTPRSPVIEYFKIFTRLCSVQGRVGVFGAGSR